MICCRSLVPEVVSDSCNPMDGSSLGSSVHGILQARILEWAAIASPIFLTQGSNLRLLHWYMGSFLLNHLGSPKADNKIQIRTGKQNEWTSLDKCLTFENTGGKEVIFSH